MARKSKTSPAKADAAAEPTAVKAASARSAPAKGRAAKGGSEKKAAAKKAAVKKRAASRLSLSLPLARARKLAGDLYEAAGLALWAEAIETAAEPNKTELVALQESICEAADFLRDAKAANPRHLQLFWVACLDRSGLPSTTPHFVTAASEEDALAICRDRFKKEFGRRRPHAFPVPPLADAPGPHE